jgi:hypothetical protein
MKAKKSPTKANLLRRKIAVLRRDTGDLLRRVAILAKEEGITKEGAVDLMLIRRLELYQGEEHLLEKEKKARAFQARRAPDSENM